jgi:uncharacterized protein YqhQ
MSEENKAAPKQFSYGGQAVIEGVMMRGAHLAAVAVRNPKGQIEIHEQPLNAALYRGRISKTPFLRGLVLLWDALGLGTRALMWSADKAMGEEDVSFNGPLGWGTVAFSLLLGIGLFFLLPTAAASGLESVLGLKTPPAQVQELPDSTAPTESGGINSSDSLPATPVMELGADIRPFVVNLLEGFVRLGLVVGYIWLIGRIPDVKRLFAYHGAEHKTINAYEAGAELMPEVVATYPIEHPRCGTAFLLTVVFVSVLVFSVLGRPPLIILLLSRVLLIPVIAGIAYEIIRFTAKNMHRPIIRAIVAPNLALQHLTTRQPDLAMIEVAIVAFKRVLVSENVIGEEDAVLPAPRPEAVSPTLAGMKSSAAS